MMHYRCSIPDYCGPDGARDPNLRGGHYFTRPTPLAAALHVAEAWRYGADRYPSRVDVQEWPNHAVYPYPVVLSVHFRPDGAVVAEVPGELGGRRLVRPGDAR